MIDIFHQEAFTDICRSDSRLRTYGILKKEAGFEKYLCELKSMKERTALTKFRISNHPLMIEKGRHQNINKENRHCPFCPGIVEDEKHFLFKCKTYSPFRCELLNEAKYHSPWKTEDYNFIAVVNDNNFLTSKFIYKSFELRQFLMARYRVND